MSSYPNVEHLPGCEFYYKDETKPCSCRVDQLELTIASQAAEIASQAAEIAALRGRACECTAFRTCDLYREFSVVPNKER